jgi:hypothetical protein
MVQERRQEMSEPLRIWWNKNLHGKISPGKLAAHAAHAALKAYGIEYDNPIVVLAAGKGRIEAMPITIHDAGHTELEPGTLTTGVEDTSHLEWLQREIATAKAQALEEFADTLGVNAGDEDDEWWSGYRNGQRQALRMASTRTAAYRVGEGATDE